MKLLLLSISLINFAFMQDECQIFEMQDECIAAGCQWNDEEGCYRFNDDENENHEDGPHECLLDCEGIEYLNPEENPYEACDWIISNFGPNNFMNSCIEDCDDETIIHINEYMEICFQCLEDNNCDDIFDNEGDGNNDWDDNENYCEDLSEDECSITEGCQWYDGEGCFRYEDEEDNDGDNDWDDENPEGCLELSQDECVSTEGCEWIGSSPNMPGGGYCIENNNEDDCNSDLVCGSAITCCDGLLYPTTCCSENCDDPIGECDDDFGDLECSDLGYQDCIDVDFCEWSSYVTPNGFFEGCVDIEENDDSVPECVMDCEGFESVDPQEDATYFCNWLLDIFPTGCAEDCEQEILDDIEQFMVTCDECLPDNSCDDVFDDNDDEYDCYQLNYADCIEAEGCEWIMGNEWGGYICVENQDEDNCSDLDYEDCIESLDCHPNYNAAGQFEGCEDSHFEPNIGMLYGRVEYIYGDAIDFIPYATLHIESLPSNADMYYFEAMSDGEGYYYIELPAGPYMVTAYANGESLTLDAQIVPNGELELNFLLGEWNGPEGPYAQLSLGDYHTGNPGSNISIPLYLSSNEFVGGVQFTILSELGLSLVEMESTDPCFSANFNMIDDTQSIGIIFSLEGCEFPPEEMLQIAHMSFNISPYVPIGVELELSFNNTIVSDSVGNEIPSYGQGAVIMLGVKGDVNADGEFNVLDVVMMVNFALYVEYPNDSQFWASDMNNDGMVNVLDVVQLVNLILN